MKINFKKDIKDLGGETLKDSAVNKLLANALSGKTPDIEPIKAMDWALKLWNEGELELDDSDKSTLKEFVTKSDGFPNLAKYAIIKILDVKE